MKKRGAVWGTLALAALALLAAACAGRALLPEQATSAPGYADERATSVFEPLGLRIDAPSGATGVVYSVVDSRIAQVTFTLEDRVYAYRAAYSEADISGVYAAFDEEASTIDASGDGWDASICIQMIDGGEHGALATWRYGEAAFSLYSPDPIDANSMGILSVVLASTAYPDYMSG